MTKIEAFEEMDERRGKLSASGMEAAFLCHGKPKAEEGKPQNVMPETTAGSRIHEAVEHDNPAALWNEDERKMAVRLMELRDNHAEEWSNGEKFTHERELRLWGFGGELSGKTDGLLRQGPRALIYDHKTGYKETIEAAANIQLRVNAALAKHNFPELTEITVAIYQPRGFPEVTKAVYDVEDLARAEAEVANAIERSKDPNARRNPGPVQCRYCRAKADCPEAQSLADKLTTVDVAEISTERLVQMLDVVETAEGVIKAVKSRAKELLEKDPAALPGWRLRPGARKTKINDPQILFGRLFQNHSIGPDAFVKICDVNKTKLRQLLKDSTDYKGKGLEAELANMLDGVTDETQNAPSLSREK